MKEDNTKYIINEFNIKGKLVNVKENTQGNINITTILTFEENGVFKKYLIQKINTNVFKEPYLVMRNIELVTEHLKRKLNSNNSITQNTLNVIKTDSGSSLVVITNENREREYYRMYEYIDNAISYDSFKECEDPIKIAYNTGKSFGLFHRMLDDFPINALVETIPDFHNTPKRFEALLESIENNVTKRAKEFAPEIVDLITKAKSSSVIWENLGKNIPLRVTHNDTKLNNVLMDTKTHDGKAIIDLDTIMPGSILFDIGDGIRSACANSFEDETNPEKIFLNLYLTKSYLSGYLEEMAGILTYDEIKNIAGSIKTLTYELTIRFLTDYINGDTYFKIKYPKHNADRFKNQYLLLCDIENKANEIQDYVFETYNDITKNKEFTRKRTL